MSVIDFLEHKKKKNEKPLVDMTDTIDARVPTILTLTNMVNDQLQQMKNSENVDGYHFRCSQIFEMLHPQLTIPIMFVKPPIHANYALEIFFTIIKKQLTRDNVDDPLFRSIVGYEALSKLINIYQLSHRLTTDVINENPAQEHNPNLPIITRGKQWEIQGKTAQLMHYVVYTTSISPTELQGKIVIGLEVPVTNNPLDNWDHLFVMDLLNYARMTLSF